MTGYRTEKRKALPLPQEVFNLDAYRSKQLFAKDVANWIATGVQKAFVLRKIGSSGVSRTIVTVQFDGRCVTVAEQTAEAHEYLKIVARVLNDVRLSPDFKTEASPVDVRFDYYDGTTEFARLNWEDKGSKEMLGGQNPAEFPFCLFQEDEYPSGGLPQAIVAIMLSGEKRRLQIIFESKPPITLLFDTHKVWAQDPTSESDWWISQVEHAMCQPLPPQVRKNFSGTIEFRYRNSQRDRSVTVQPLR